MVIAAFAAGFTAPQAAGAATQKPAVATAKQMETIIGRGVRATAGGRYEAALREFGRVVEKAPGEAAGYFFLASVYSVLAGHFDDPAYREGFERNAFRAVEIAEARIKADPKDGRAHMFAGLALGILGMDAARQKSYVRAFLRTRRTAKFLERAIALDPGLEDAYYALGLYYYWRVRAEWFRRLAPLLGDTGEKGIRYIRRTAERGRWLRDLARIELVYVLYHEGKFEEARGLISGIIEKFPSQPYYRFARAEGYFIEKDFGRARTEFRRVRERLLNGGGRIARLYADFAEWRIVRSEFELGNLREARRGAEAVRSKPGRGSHLLRRVRAAAAEMIRKIDGGRYPSDRFPAPRRER
jgi:tetratricopeptide (TPR) repeat protein